MEIGTVLLEFRVEDIDKALFEPISKQFVVFTDVRYYDVYEIIQVITHLRLFFLCHSKGKIFRQRQTDLFLRREQVLCMGGENRKIMGLTIHAVIFR